MTCATATCSDAGACVGATAGTSNSSCQFGDAEPVLCGVGASADSCCTSIEVPGGTYNRIYDSITPEGGIDVAADGGPVGPGYPATISGFRLDKYEVTVNRFRQFAEAWMGGYTPPMGSGVHLHLNGRRGLLAVGYDGGVHYEQGWIPDEYNPNLAPYTTNLTCASPDTAYTTWTATPGSNEARPMTCENWYEAYAFCIWDGGFLPSEAEWEYAAAGGDEQLEFPWGAAAPGSDSLYAIYGCNYPVGGASCSGVGNIAVVGTATMGAGRWGHLDLAGSVWEWDLDWHGSYVVPCGDCAYLAPNTLKMLRGSDFADKPLSYLVSSYRHKFDPTARGYNFGFRCARVP